MSAPNRPSRTVAAGAARLLAAVLVLSCALVSSSVGAAPASAQARLVNALVRTFPPRPDPGDDVTVLVGVTGCPAGAVTVEIYLTTSDGATQAATLMTRGAATTNLVHRTKAVLQLPEAIEGWYGARVLCGNFRPPKVAMTNTLFAVGSKPTKESNLAGNTVVAGGTLPFSGNGCPGTEVEYDISGGARWPGPFDPDGTIPVDPDGTWATDLLFPAETNPGPASVRARCVLENQFGEVVYIYYGGMTEVTVERPPPPTLAPPPA